MTEIHNKEKLGVALNSVFAAIFLTASKIIVGVMTGSLGILSEALHSALDLVAAAITYFSVRVSDKPADDDHHFGHGKIENLSALIETVLLLVTCIWIVYEATHRLTTGNWEIEVTYWSYIVVVSSIIIDVWRSRALMKAAKKFNSQALEADALHFSTDIWSSAVVLLGLICSNFGIYWADSVAALGVAFIVIGVSYRLGKKAIVVLLDQAPAGMKDEIRELAVSINEVKSISQIRIRNAGADYFVDITAQANYDMSFVQAHELSHKIEHAVQAKISRCDVTVHLEPR